MPDRNLKVCRPEVQLDWTARLVRLGRIAFEGAVAATVVIVVVIDCLSHRDGQSACFPMAMYDFHNVLFLSSLRFSSFTLLLIY